MPASIHVLYLGQAEFIKAADRLVQGGLLALVVQVEATGELRLYAYPMVNFRMLASRIVFQGDVVGQVVRGVVHRQIDLCLVLIAGKKSQFSFASSYELTLGRKRLILSNVSKCTCL